MDWTVADITQWEPERACDIWRDRALFHFLTVARDRQSYKQRLRRALAPKRAVIIATFSLDGPERCSGLPVERYDSESLAAELGPEFEQLHDWTGDHVTPAGNRQAFTCVFRGR